MKIFDKIKKNKEIRHWRKQAQEAEEFCSRAMHMCNKECEDCAWGRIIEDAESALKDLL